MVNIRQLRRSKKLTQSQLAERIGVVPQSICSYETGKVSPSVQVIKLIAKELDFVWWEFYEEN